MESMNSLYEQGFAQASGDGTGLAAVDGPGAAVEFDLADILQFQFHRALSQTAGCTEPLNRCSIFGNRAAGDKLNSMLEMGLSRPWQNRLIMCVLPMHGC